MTRTRSPICLPFGECYDCNGPGQPLLVARFDRQNRCISNELMWRCRCGKRWPLQHPHDLEDARRTPVWLIEKTLHDGTALASKHELLPDDAPHKPLKELGPTTTVTKGGDR